MGQTTLLRRCINIIDVDSTSQQRLLPNRLAYVSHSAVVKVACLESRSLRVQTPLWPSSFKETKMILLRSLVKIMGNLRDREVACSTSDRQGSNFESCVWRAESSHSSPHTQEVLLARFSLYVHKGGLKPQSFHFLRLSQRPSHDKLPLGLLCHM